MFQSFHLEIYSPEEDEDEDADNENGEGLQIDKGEINFLSFFEVLNDKIKANGKQFSWIPEIWQGHENNGKGFEIALNQLCDYL